MGIAALVIGIVAVIIGFIPGCGIIALLPAIVGLILGIIEVKKKSKAGQPKGKGMAGREAVRLAILEEVHGAGSGEAKTLGEGTLGKATVDIFGRPMGPAFPPQYNLSEEAKARIRKELGL